MSLSSCDAGAARGGARRCGWGGLQVVALRLGRFPMRELPRAGICFGRRLRSRHAACAAGAGSRSRLASLLQGAVVAAVATGA
ncbi:hypothetical protein AZ78_2915 [Lysobacter capsici AZ78]|uniref:Uncharacterized protein n=1 Tax=Lysobacter capsici AZ78 TaxID=1444315 RepID=A0A108UA48_9GAMM|nr:hypothetical protein AZ78_2915 [Lysobacter capsici AZ78]